MHAALLAAFTAAQRLETFVIDVGATFDLTINQHHFTSVDARLLAVDVTGLPSWIDPLVYTNLVPVSTAPNQPLKIFVEGDRLYANLRSNIQVNVWDLLGNPLPSLAVSEEMRTVRNNVLFTCSHAYNISSFDPARGVWLGSSCGGKSTVYGNLVFPGPVDVSDLSSTGFFFPYTAMMDDVLYADERTFLGRAISVYKPTQIRNLRLHRGPVCSAASYIAIWGDNIVMTSQGSAPNLMCVFSPSAQITVATLSLTLGVRDLNVYKGYAYVTTPQFIAIYNLSNGSIIQVGSWTMQAPASPMWVEKDNYVYLARDPGKTSVFDMSNPLKPILLNEINHKIYAINGSIGYSAPSTSSEPIFALNLSTTPPSVIAQSVDRFVSTTCQLHKEILFCYASGSYYWFDKSLRRLGIRTQPGSPMWLHKAHNTLWVGLQVWDLSSPDFPVMGSWGNWGTQYHVVAWIEQVLYVLTPSGLCQFTMSNRGFNRPLSTMTAQTTQTVQLLAAHTGSIAVLGQDIRKFIRANNNTLTLSGVETLESTISGFASYGPVIYACLSGHGLRIYHINLGSKPIKIGSYNQECSEVTINTNLNRAYLTVPYGFQILDVSQLRLHGVPTGTNLGQYQFNVTAYNHTGYVETKAINLVVTQFPKIARPPLSPSPLSTRKPFQFSFPLSTFSDPNDSPLSFSSARKGSSELPLWLYFNSTTLTYTGTAPEDPHTFYAVIQAKNVFGGWVNLTFLLEIISTHPFLKNQISTQSATVGQPFRFAIPDNTFSTLNIRYTAELVQLGEQTTPLPLWLKLDGALLHGTPGRGDKDWFSSRQLEIIIIGSDLESQGTDSRDSASTTFNLIVSGTSYAELMLKISSPVLSIVGAGLAIYRRRAIVLNVTRKKQYQRVRDTVMVGQSYSRQLDTPARAVAKVIALIHEPPPQSGRCLACRKLWAKEFIPIPDGQLSGWLSYKSATNRLVSNWTPESDDVGVFIIQVQDHAQCIREQFRLEVVEDNNNNDDVERNSQRDISLRTLSTSGGGSNNHDGYVLLSNHVKHA